MMRDYIAALFCGVAVLLAPVAAFATDGMHFTAVEDEITPIVNAINSETVRIDISAWYLTEHAISEALVSAHGRGVAIRVIGDRASIFEIDPNTKTEFFYLAQHGVAIRLRYNPVDFPEIDHWKAGIFVGQGLLEFGSANWTTFELRPASSTNYHDETVFFTTDSTLFNAFATVFDQYWADTATFLNWPDAYQRETGHAWASDFPSAAPMSISTARLVPDNPLPASVVWGQGDDFNNALVRAINAETSEIDFVIYRLTVDSITNALLQKAQSGVPVRLIVEPNEYRNGRFPEFELTGAKLDSLWAAGVPMKQRIHVGLTHMKTLVTSTVATNASSNYTAHYQRDHDYFVGALDKPAIYSALKNRFSTMWNDSSGFAPFQPQPPDWANITAPASQSAGVAMSPTFQWDRAKWAVYYDVYLGTSSSSMQLVQTINGDISENPPSSYSWRPSWSLQANTQYVWRVVTRTFATAKNASLVNTSPTFSFTTGSSGGVGGTQPPAPPSPPPPPPAPAPSPTPPAPPSPPAPAPPTPAPPSPPAPPPPAPPAPTPPAPPNPPPAPAPSAGPTSSAFDKQVPSFGNNDSNSSVILTWTPMADAAYGVCLQQTASDTCESAWWLARRPSMQVNGLSPGTYYWQVVALTPGGRVEADGGAWGSFSIAGEPHHRPRSGPAETSGRAKPRSSTSASHGSGHVTRR